MVNASSSIFAPDLCILTDGEPPGSATESKLARHLNIPCLSTQQSLDRAGLYLQFRDGQLRLGRLGAREHPVAVDFVSSLINPRRGPELLLKAIGATPSRHTVVDATAGLGRDSVILLGAGYKVTMIEENPVAVALLNDALARLRKELATSSHADKIALLAGQAEQVLPTLAQQDGADVIYLDPMFAASGKSALVKKDMQLFQSLLGHGGDAAELLEVALSTAKYRVVVKRAIKAQPLADRQPTLSVSGKAVRFDVYALRSLKRD